MRHYHGLALSEDRIRDINNQLTAWGLLNKVLDRKCDSLKVLDITADSKAVDFIAKIISAYEIKEFTRDDETIGRVANPIVGDETGKIRVTLWDNNAGLIKTGKIKVGQTVQIGG